jgi:hypothetical protein
MLVAPALFLAALALYLATLTEVHTFDALSYVTSVERKPWTELLHPHHLAYGPLGALALTAAQALGYTGGAALPLQLVNAAAGALGVALLYRTARRVTGRADAALAAALLLAGSYAYWYYAVEIEVYTLAALFLILCLDLMARPPPWTKRRLLALGLAHGAATLFHQTNILLCLPILVYAILDSPLRGTRFWISASPNRQSKIERWSVYALAFGSSVALPYLYAMLAVSGFRTWEASLAWLTAYARTGWWGGALGPQKLADLGRGLADTLAQPGGGLMWLALGVIALAGMRSTFNVPTFNVQRSNVQRSTSLVWLATYAAFFTWWEPLNVEFWIAVLPPLLLLLAQALAGGRGWRWRPVAAVGVALAALVTNYGSIARRGDAVTDLQRVVARALAERSTPADLLLVPDGLLELYLPYYEGHENFLSLNQALFDADGDWRAACDHVRARIDTAQHAGATALIAEEALRPKGELLARHRITQAQVDACFAPYSAALMPLDLPAAVPRTWRLPTGDELAAGPGWRFEAYAAGWRAENVADARFDAGWRFRPGVDPALASPLLSLDATSYRAIVVRMASGASARDAQLFFAGPDGHIAEERSLRWTLDASGEAVTYTLDLRGAPGWTGTIARLRLDPVSAGDGGEIRVEWIRLVR